LKQSSSVLSATSGYGLPGDRFAGDGVTIGNEKKERSANVFIGDYDYVKTLGLRVIAGRDFSRDMATDGSEAFIINQTAVKEWGLGTPQKAVGLPVSWNEWVPQDTLHPVKKGKVIGVIEDFHCKSLHEKVVPCVIQLYPQVEYAVAVKLKAANMQNSITYINGVWNKFVPGYPLDYKFMDESYSVMYKSEEKLADLLWILPSWQLLSVAWDYLDWLHSVRATHQGNRNKKSFGRQCTQYCWIAFEKLFSPRSHCIADCFSIAWWAMNKWLKISHIE
jgi:putative ABC transport system permease protein